MMGYFEFGILMCTNVAAILFFLYKLKFMTEDQEKRLQKLENKICPCYTMTNCQAEISEQRKRLDKFDIFCAEIKKDLEYIKKMIVNYRKED